MLPGRDPVDTVDESLLKAFRKIPNQTVGRKKHGNTRGACLPVYLILLLSQLGRCRPSRPWIRSSHSAFCEGSYRLGNLSLGFGFHPKPGLAPPHSRDRIRRPPCTVSDCWKPPWKYLSSFLQGRRPYDFVLGLLNGEHFAFFLWISSMLGSSGEKKIRSFPHLPPSLQFRQNSPCPFGFSFHRGSVHDRLGSLFLRFAWWSDRRRDWIRASKSRFQSGERTHSSFGPIDQAGRRH